jgi:hypothetical protein
VKVTVSADAGVPVAAAVSVVLCAVPGVNVSVAGFAVTPLGSPVIAMATVPLKPFTAVASTLTWGPCRPSRNGQRQWVRVSAKSPAAAAAADGQQHGGRMTESSLKFR